MADHDPQEKRCCTRCEVEKPLTEFYKRSDVKDGYRPWCKKCSREVSSKWEEENRERKRAKAKKWQEENRDRATAKRREWERLNPEQTRENQRRTEEKHRDRTRARWRLKAAVRRGKITKPDTCERCGFTAELPREIHGHHHDYAKPLEVEWLCQSCHTGADKERA